MNGNDRPLARPDSAPGLLLAFPGYRLSGEDDHDAAKDIDDLPVVNLAVGSVNWNRAPQNIDIEHAAEVQNFINRVVLLSPNAARIGS